MSKPNSADITTEWLLSCMDAHVRPHVAGLRESTATDRTMQRLLSTVKVSRVPHQLLPALEPLWTCAAGVRPIIGVHSPDVRPQSAKQLELSTTLITVVWQLVAAMHPLDVYAQDRSELEAEPTLTTNVRTRVRVGAFMVVACRALTKAFLAAWISTGEWSITTMSYEVCDKQLAMAKMTPTLWTNMLHDHVFTLLPSAWSTLYTLMLSVSSTIAARGSAMTLMAKFNYTRNFCYFTVHPRCIW